MLPSLAISLVSARSRQAFQPADDHLEGELDLNELLIQNGPATFFVRARGDSMNGEHPTIQDGDLLVVDKSRTPRRRRGYRLSGWGIHREAPPVHRTWHLAFA